MHLAQLLDPLLRCTNVKVMVPRLPDAPYAVLEPLRLLASATPAWLGPYASREARLQSLYGRRQPALLRLADQERNRSGITTYPITSHG